MATSPKPKVPVDARDILLGLLTPPKADELSFTPGVDDEGINHLTPKYYFRTGISVLDVAIGNGGLGTGRITEIYGPNKTAKSELVFRILECFLTDYPDGVAIVYDQELAMDNKKIEACPALVAAKGRWTIQVRPTLERLLSDITNVKGTGMLDKIRDHKIKRPILIIVDSLKALETEEEANTDLEKEGRMAPQARVLSKALPKLNPILSRTNTALIFTNQIRKKPGVPTFIDDESPGGEALKFYASWRIMTGFKGKFSMTKGPRGGVKGEPQAGSMIGFKTVKNKLATPDRIIEVPLVYNAHGGYNSGLSDPWSLFYTLKLCKFIKSKAGKYYIKGNASEVFDRSGWYAMMEANGFTRTSTVKDRLLLTTPLGLAFQEWASWIMDPLSGKVDLSGDEDDLDLMDEVDADLDDLDGLDGP